MKVSRKFLNDYIDIDGISTQDLADKLVSVGNEYDSVSKFVPATNLVIGHVVECEMHPESKKLHICKIDLGDEIVQIVCGAPNMRKGLKVIVARVGSNLPGGVIKKAKLAGYESNGMVCAFSELGIPHKFLRKEDIEGIYELPEDAPVGEDPLKYLGLDDEVIDFDFTSNRADMLSMIGIAYETGAAYGKDIKLPENECEEIAEDVNDIYKIDVKTDKCMAYLGKMVRGVKVDESPEFIRNRLMASDIRPINNVVDISNYVMLEYGTPLHFFDADKLGNKVIVRDAKKGEKLVTLDGVERKLDESDIVIANDKEAVALAGVMGGLDTEVTSETKNIFIECAIFDKTSVRVTSKKILRSESSNRFEKGIDPNRILPAIKRAAYLLNKYAGGSVLTGVAGVDKTSKEDKVIKVTLDKINKVLGMSLSKDDVIDSLERLKFKVSFDNGEFTVLVPTRRLDVNIREDIIEEVGRIYGYDKIKGVLPEVSIKCGGRSKLEEMNRTLRDKLISLGLNQVLTYSLLSDRQSSLFNDDKNKVYLLNPMSEDRKVLRTTLLASLLEVFEYNYAHNAESVNIFETASVYFTDDDYSEKPRIAGLMYGDYMVNAWEGIKVWVNFYTLKGVLTSVFDYLGLGSRLKFEAAERKDMHPYRCANVLIGREVIGYMGQVHPSVCDKEVYVFELDVDKIMNQKVKNIKYKEYSKYPSVSKDLAFLAPKDMKSEDILEVIKRSAGRLLSDAFVFDVYEGDGVSDGMKSIAYNLTFTSFDRTLSDDEVNKITENVVKNVHDKLGVNLR